MNEDLYPVNSSCTDERQKEKERRRGKRKTNDCVESASEPVYTEDRKGI